MFDKIKSTFVGDDRAVSPVIGVILMVAITVILAAVIASMTLGLGDSVQENVNAGANINFDDANNQVDVTYTTAGNADEIVVTVEEVDVSGTFTSSSATMDEVGQVETFGAGSLQDGDEVRVTVVAYKGDSKTVIQQTTESV
ncbi:type IV pilin [Halomarina rubra]|uniref:Type IV pilin n=1 Tax=Halomarina rubra TaxID=2071873 RepID=A0ABD6AS76_9EURY|nr:type IV pilin [Halomarina rubra]